MAEITLSGLHTEPVAQYLAALGVLRLVAEQVDPQATGHWQADTFVLDSALDEDELVAFFAKNYIPTPIVGPWNGGSGFYPPKKIGNKEKLLDDLLATTDPRLEQYRRTVTLVRELLRSTGRTEAGDDKDALLELLRAELSDEAIAWLDAVFALASKPEYAPLLGSGGNDGNFEFSFNLISTLLELIEYPDRGMLRACLFGEATPGLRRTVIGHFSPVMAGGVNRGRGFGGHTQVNPWLYTLMLEGTLVLSGSVSRRLESSRGGSPAFPFVVRSAAVGFASAAPSEESRSEQWFPIWENPSPYPEVRHLFAEGRAKVSSMRSGLKELRTAVDGLDFARAIATLGVDRGVSAFARFGFQKRNGKMYFAVPLGRWVVRSAKGADLLAEIDGWLGRVRGFVGSGKAPTSVERANNRLEAAIMAACQREDDPATTLELLATLGELELALGRAKKRTIDPLPSLAPEWYTLTQREGSCEFELAAALASGGVRPRVTNVERRGAKFWAWTQASSKVATWMEGASLDTNLVELLRRRDIEVQQGGTRDRFADALAAGVVERRDGRDVGRPRVWASLDAVAQFIDGRVDDDRLERLLRGLALIDWARVRRQPAPKGERVAAPAAFALLALARESTMPGSDQRFPETPGMLTLAAAGRLREATAMAVRRLRAGGLAFVGDAIDGPAAQSRRVAAALAFPLAPTTLERLRELTFPRFKPPAEEAREDFDEDSPRNANGNQEEQYT